MADSSLGNPAVAARPRDAQALFRAAMLRNYRDTDRVFAVLMAIQFVAGIGVALWISPRTWEGTVSDVHPHVWAALVIGGLTNLFPAAMAVWRPGEALTRHVVAVGQVLTSALLIHLTGGRIETHFHVFGSLAFLAFYRDWKVLISATVVVAADHFLRGVYFPQSVFGIVTPQPWRWLEHAFWVVFEDTVLILAIKRGIEESRQIALREEESNLLNEARAQQVAQTQEAMEQLQGAQAQLVQAEKMAALGALVAGVAHEISTPVGIGVTAASHLQDEVRKMQKAAKDDSLTRDQFQQFLADSQQAADIILTNLGRSASLVQSFKRIAVDQTTEEQRRINLKAYIDETLLSLRPRLKHSPHRILFDCPSDLEIDTVPGAISQIVTNLVVNSMVHAFTPDRPGTLRIAVSRRDNTALLRFADDGAGIPQENLSRVFDPFFTTKRGQGGTGLGLNIVYNLVHRLGGTIEVSSITGKGATFTVELPAVAD